MEIKTSLTVIEFHHEYGVEWSLSFGGHNPSTEDYFVMDKETAFRLKDRLSTMFPPVSSNKPVTGPSDKL